MTDSVAWLAGRESTYPRRQVDPLVGHRSEAWRWDLLTLTDAPAGMLDGVEGAQLDFSIHNTIRSGGSLTWSGSDAPDWMRIRLQPWYTLATMDGDEMSWPLGVFIPAAPKVSYTDDGASVGVELYDKLLVLDQDKVEATHTEVAGAVVTERIRALIASTGEYLIAVEDSGETLSAPMVWEAGTSKLAIINDLLDAINYFSLWCDGYGTYRADPYTAPTSRPLAREFLDDEHSIYAPDFTHDRDDFNVPNKLVLVARSDGETEALISTATNVDPASPYSYPSRGRWLTHVETDVEATSQAVLDGIASRRLAEKAQVASTFDIEHALIPLDLNALVAFRRSPAGIHAHAVVQKMSIDTATGALVATTLREVS